ncbi:hypothetical protein [Halomonas sp.]|uniref:hypothetical protein n=1 Tax=Halomonas sp. TaxID=1486246 RepID=UPI002357BA9D|nr:hypothetical protein [Halomonas sp.]
MKTTDRITRALDLFWKLLTGVVMTAFALMLVIMAIQVISRYVLGIAVSWTDEASRYLFLPHLVIVALPIWLGNPALPPTVSGMLVLSRDSLPRA